MNSVDNEWEVSSLQLKSDDFGENVCEEPLGTPNTEVSSLKTGGQATGNDNQALAGQGEFSLPGDFESRPVLEDSAQSTPANQLRLPIEEDWITVGSTSPSLADADSLSKSTHSAERNVCVLPSSLHGFVIRISVQHEEIFRIRLERMACR